MHASVLEFVRSTIHPNEIRGARVLEVGSRNINGSVRDILLPMRPQTYVGIDLDAGAGVDHVCSVEDFCLKQQEYGAPPWDYVVSCEMLEHAKFWESAFKAMSLLLRDEGTLILTARGPGFPYHNPPDRWRFTCDDMIRACAKYGLNARFVQNDPQVPGVFLLAQKVGKIEVSRMLQPEELDFPGLDWSARK